MTKTSRTTAISALVLSLASVSPAAWAGDKSKHQSDHHSRSGQQTVEPKTSHDGEHNPPGNNGTVKIHQVAGDTSPHNVPHVTCEFYITFFGFDTNQTADLTLTGQAPTGKGTPLWSRDDALISTDDAGGGKEIDNEIHVTAAELGLDRLGAPHPKQGYHVKLDVDVNGAPGGEKHKVFWVEPCAAPAAVEGTSGNVGGTTGTTTVVSGVGQTVGQTPGAVSGTGITRGRTSRPTTPGAQVLGVEYTRASDQGTGTGVLGTSLPFTGVPVVGLAAVAALAVGAGVVMVQAGRRRENEA